MSTFGWCMDGHCSDCRGYVAGWDGQILHCSHDCHEKASQSPVKGSSSASQVPGGMLTCATTPSAYRGSQ